MPGSLKIFDVSWFLHYGSKSIKTRDYAFAGYPMGGIKFLVSNVLQELITYSDVICCFDSRTNKHVFMPEYKMNRPREAYIQNQAQYIYNMMMKCGICCYKVDGAESDDLIYSSVKKYRTIFHEITCYSNDRDIAHNVFNNVKVSAACDGGMDITPSNFSFAVQTGDVVEYNTISAYKVLIKDSSDSIRLFRSESGLNGREIYSKYVLWGQETLKDNFKRPYLYADESIFRYFLNTLNLSEKDMTELDNRIKVVFPKEFPDVPAPSNRESLILDNLSKLLTVLSDDIYLSRLSLKKCPLSSEEFNEFKVNAEVLRDGTFAVDNDLPVHDSFISFDDDEGLYLRYF